MLAHGSKTNEERKLIHANRLKVSKLREALKSLKSAGITLEELQEYVKQVGFDTPEKGRMSRMLDYRRKKATEEKRQINIAKAREAKKTAKQQSKEVPGLA